jgi:hypothetical protein
VAWAELTGWNGSAATLRLAIRWLEGSSVGRSGQKAEGRKGGVRAAEGKRNGERKGGFTRRRDRFILAHEGGGGRWGRATWQVSAERERERGCPTPTGGRCPAGSGLRLVGTGGVVRPCCGTGPNRGGGMRLTGGPPNTVEGSDG